MKLLRNTLLVTAVTLLVASSPALAAGAPTWKGATALAFPPSEVSLPQGYLPGLACPSAGNCVAAGEYVDSATNYYGVIVTETGGVWKTGRVITPPANAAPGAGINPYAVSCGSVGNCVVVGNYFNSAGDALSFIDEETAGTWGGATQVNLPPDALGVGQSSNLRAVSCASAGNCAAVGTYTRSGPANPTSGYLLSEVNGGWHTTELILPGRAALNPFVSLSQVSCASAGACVAAGTYLDVNNTTHLGVVSAKGGSWSPMAALRLPANASAFPAVSVGAATCADAGDCLVIASYENAKGQRQALAASSRGGVWRRASALRMPAGAGPNPHAFFYGFAGAACASAGNCTTGGQYRDAAGTYQGFLVNEVDGTWQAATQLALPAGAHSSGANGGVVSLTCASAGECTAGAAYLDASGQYQAFLVSETANHWAPGTTVTLPGGATTVGVDGGVYGVVCSASDRCTATGTYLDATGGYQAFAVTTG